MADLDQRGWTMGEVVALLETVETTPLFYGEGRMLKFAFEALRAVEPHASGSKCPGCQAGVLVGEQARHAERCLRYPARLRHEALLRVAARLVEAHGGPNALEPMPPLVYPPPDVEHRPGVRFPEALERLDAEYHLAEKDRPSYASVVLGELRWRVHVVARETEPCPWCRAVLPATDFHQHLWRCEAHPAARRVVALSDALRERFGDAAVDAAFAEEAVQSARASLLALVQACGQYGGSMGYHGDGKYYTKHWSETPWLAALDVAECTAREARATSMSPGVERHITAIETLLRHCRSFWNGMGDDVGGRSIIESEECRAWEAQVAAAAATLEAA